MEGSQKDNPVERNHGRGANRETPGTAIAARESRAEDRGGFLVK